ncbi:MAG TPA: TetR family transcriptional regulator [Steroidobacteraceae bacterium]|nr:TetR family transcriptional regulator [Steroidobacteraceae bacterium]
MNVKGAEATVKRSYHSPLRDRQRSDTSERILDACNDLVAAGKDLTVAAVARAAGVQERTVYRHFATKEDLEDAFWWSHEEHVSGPGTFDAQTLDELVANLKKSFAGFEANSAMVEAMLSSRQGMRLRLRGNDARRKMMLRCVDAAVPGLEARTLRRAAAAAQVLYSAPSWQMLRTFWGMDAVEASAVVEQALSALAEGLGRRAEMMKSR